MPIGTAATASAAAGARDAADHALRWPLSGLLAWSAAWGVHVLMLRTPAPDLAAPLAASAVGFALAIPARTRMRRLLTAAGFPLSWMALGGAAGWPAWAWLLPLALLALAYPLQAWRDAPLFPTPDGALDGLAALAPLGAGARVIDAGCGLGHGLAALRRAYPAARFEGIEWSWPVALAARWRCRGFARVRRGDMWRDDWRGAGLVYLFQRPESMPRAVEKARRELPDGAWLASLEFEAAGLRPQAVLQPPDGRAVWLYRAPFVDRAGEPARSTSSPARERR